MKLPTSPLVRLTFYAIGAFALMGMVKPFTAMLAAQSEADGGPSALPPPTGSDEPAAPAAPVTPPPSQDLNVFTLAMNGGIFMYPIYALSILGVTMTIERALALRRSRVIPTELVTSLGQLGSQTGFDPRKAYRICQQYPSAAANVIRAMLLKVGRPVSEVEHTIAETSNREAERLYYNIRWINLAASVAPLLGLIGTIQGMIIAFHEFTGLAPGQNQAATLAAGIYVALVTTFAGLTVAIPAAVASHYFEGRIISFFHEIDELAFNLLPQLERYEGRLRFSRQSAEGDNDREPGDQPMPAAVGK